jgi:hypothetical protein
MGKKKRKIWATPEERAAFYEGWEERTRQLEARIEKLDAELAARGRKRRGLEYWLERHKAERAAREQPST